MDTNYTKKNLRKNLSTRYINKSYQYVKKDFNKTKKYNIKHMI